MPEDLTKTKVDESCNVGEEDSIVVRDPTDNSCCG